MEDLACILRWYAKKAQAEIRDYVLPTLVAAMRAESWPPGASRRVRAALNKQSVAIRFARKNDRREHRDGDAGLLGDVAERRGDRYYAAEVRSFPVVHAMMFGQFARAPAMLALAAQLFPYCACDAEREALGIARAWAQDFAPVAEVVARLDAARPAPTFAFGEISPTVLANVGQAMGLAFETVRMPEFRRHRVERVNKKGEIEIVFWFEILWPAGTRHGASRYAMPHQCQACGHAIRRADNWVPLVLDSVEVWGDGSRRHPPASLWVGRDCARHLFGCVVTHGDGVELRRGGPAPEGAG